MRNIYAELSGLGVVAFITAIDIEMYLSIAALSVTIISMVIRIYTRLRTKK